MLEGRGNQERDLSWLQQIEQEEARKANPEYQLSYKSIDIYMLYICIYEWAYMYV